MNIQEWLTQSTDKLQRANINSARLDSLLILEFVLNKSREWILSHSEEMLSQQITLKLNTILKQRLQHTPIAYITARKEFYGRSFFVDKNVLIPRSESESIIELLIALDQSKYDSIIDIGTGSGCLAITAKLERPDAKVMAIDISDKVLSVASKNASRLGVDIDFIKSDLFESFKLIGNSVLLVNLPYVPDGLITSEEVLKEPSTAIFSGADGLDDYRRFWDKLGGQPDSGYAVITESLVGQHSDMVLLAKEAGYKIVRTSGLAQLFFQF